LQVKTSAP